MAEYNITNLNNKIETEGATSQGRLSASEFNLLVDAVIDSQKKIAEIKNYFIPISEEEYDNLAVEGALENRPYFVYEE